MVENKQMSEEKEIVVRTRTFAIDIITFASSVRLSPVTQTILRQLVRCGTSIGANVEEAQGSISKRDFTQKILSASKKPAKLVIGYDYWLRQRY